MLFPRSTSVLSASLIFNDSSYAWSLLLFRLHVALNPSCLRFPDFGLLRDLKIKILVHSPIAVAICFCVQIFLKHVRFVVVINMKFGHEFLKLLWWNLSSLSTLSVEV